ncbi:MAG: hypothetical protein IPH45_18530, partial [Bacteroidales bacterium]|nr:hypothetical protein [Bacteroidales bacterium]
MKSYIKNIFRFSTIIVILTLGWGLQLTLGLSSGPRMEGRLTMPPDSTDNDDTTLRFPFEDESNPYERTNQSGLYLKNPSNVKEDVIYDPTSKEYTFTRKIGEMDYKLPASLSFDEYKNWDLK